jgi:hypothetical protein
MHRNYLGASKDIVRQKHCEPNDASVGVHATSAGSAQRALERNSARRMRLRRGRRQLNSRVRKIGNATVDRYRTIITISAKKPASWTSRNENRTATTELVCTRQTCTSDCSTREARMPIDAKSATGPPLPLT